MTDPAEPHRSAARRHLSASDLRGASRLAVDATLGLTDLVENLHHNILRAPGPLGAASQGSTGGITGLVYRSVRGVTRLVGGTVDALLGQVLERVGPAAGRAATPEREAVLSALNGVLGDHLAATGNPLAIPMTLRPQGPSGSCGRVLLMVHGLCMGPLQWRRKGHDHGRALAAEGGFTALYLHYNSGLPIASNARLLADQLQARLHSADQPLDELVIIGHSMGGLVARSACEQALARGHEWPERLSKMVFLGTPHHGAALERGGHWVDVVLGKSPYTAAFARLGKLRSAGITDLRHGSAQPLPAGVACHAIAGSLGSAPGTLGEMLLGDGLVSVDSALGRHANPALSLQFEPAHQWVGQGMGHLDLLDRAEVLAKLRSWLLA